MLAFRRIVRFVVVIASLGLASGAAGVAGATELSFTGTLQIQIGTVLAPFSVEAHGVAEVQLDAGQSVARIDLPGGAFVTQTLVVPVTDPSSAPIRGLMLREFANQTGVFVRDGSSALAGSMPLSGEIRVCLFGDCSVAISSIVVPVSAIGTLATSQVTDAVNLTVQGAPWTSQTAAVGSVTQMGSDSGLDLNLVTPVMVSTNIGASAVVPVFGFLSFAFEEPGEHCNNQIDDDGDGATDYPEDPGCESATDTSERSPTVACDNGIDDDGDRRIDLRDPGCQFPSDASERSPSLPCDNGIDDDGDGFVDQDDPGCGDPADPSERGEFACENFLDDDGDGFVDRDDPGCTSDSDDSEREAGAECDDGVDGDRDGEADFPDDTGCASIADPSERTPTLVCDDGIDNDGDGAVDFVAQGPGGDRGCSSRTDPSERSPTLACDDGLDNDGDGTRDYPEDPGCDAGGFDSSELSPFLPCDNGLDDDEDGAIDSQQDPGCTDPRDPRESVDYRDGGYWGIGAVESQADDVTVEDGPTGWTSLDVLPDGVIGGDLTATGASRVRLRGGSIEGSLFAEDFAEVEILSGAIGGEIEARDAATITIFGSGFDLPLGAVAATSGSLAGYLVDGTPFVWSFVRDAGASIVLAPEPGAVAAALAALAALRSVRRHARSAAHRSKR